MARTLSTLGVAIEDAVASRFQPHSERVKYMAYFRTPRGSVFAVEQGTSKHINLWLPEQEAVRHEAERERLHVNRSVPWPDATKPNRYGRISSLQSVQELCDAILLKVQVTTVGKAMRVLE